MKTTTLIGKLRWAYPILALALMAGLCSTCPAHAAQYSKLGIITAAKQLGKWEALKAYITAAGYEDEWAACAFLSDEYPTFAAITNAVCATGMATPEEVAAILAAAEDKAPDALLPVFYTREMQSGSGRVKWHGARVRQAEIEVEPGKYRLIEEYADGYIYTNAVRVIHRDDPEEEARRRAAEEAARQARERALYPATVAEILAKRRAAATTTNEVNVVITT